jgi:hypothetical protein
MRQVLRLTRRRACFEKDRGDRMAIELFAGKQVWEALAHGLLQRSRSKVVCVESVQFPPANGNAVSQKTVMPTRSSGTHCSAARSRLAILMTMLSTCRRPDQIFGLRKDTECAAGASAGIVRNYFVDLARHAAVFLLRQVELLRSIHRNMIQRRH